MQILPRDMTSHGLEPFELVDVKPDPHSAPCPGPWRHKIAIDVIHDGCDIPKNFLRRKNGGQIWSGSTLPRAFVRERDWGAELLAGKVASALHIPHYFRINTARVLLDFGRFPGITSRAADHMNRFAINYPFSAYLSHEHKRELLTAYYDGISEGMETYLEGKHLKLAIHTYDKHNASATRRPAVSLVTRVYGHQRLEHNPVRNFDPLFPNRLGEVTADRLLRTRIALALEERGIHTEENYPYALPEGSVEMRAQVWYFFRYVRDAYLRFYDGPAHSQESWDLVWRMLLDTNLRSTVCQALRGYLHMFRRPPAGMEALFQGARQEYERIASFIGRNGKLLVSEYNSALLRPSTLLVEVRKDLVWNYSDRRPIEPNVERAEYIARSIANGVRAYLEEDRSQRAQSITLYEATN